MGRRRFATVDAVQDHNAARWLAVEYREKRGYSGRVIGPGWYVVRRCPCHEGQVVSSFQDSESAAHRVMRRIIGASLVG